MKIAVLSGKGGTGKTFVAVNLAAAAGLRDSAVYADCDVEEPNGALFFSVADARRQEVCRFVPAFDEACCDACRACVSFCRFHALMCLGHAPRVFAEMCHSCGGCALVCPHDAVTMQPRRVGLLQQATVGRLSVIGGKMEPGEASGMPIVHAVLHASDAIDAPVKVIDGPPGSACLAGGCAANADFCLLVTEPTAFGLHNLAMVHELVRVLKKPCAVVINKQTVPYEPLEAYCSQNGLAVLERFFYTRQVAQACARGEIVALTQPAAWQMRFQTLLARIGEMAQ